MAGFPYGSANSGVRHLYDDTGLHHNFTSAYTNPNSVELLFQQHISSEQLRSPTMPQPAARHSISQQQAGSQPYGTTFIESHTGNSYPQRPMTMRRSASSQYSSNSSGYQRSGNLQRPSRNSFGNDSRPHAIEMARAPSQYSSAPMHQAAHHPNATQPHLDTSNYYPSPLPPSSSPANPQYDPISATGTSDSVLDFGVSEIMGRHSVEAEEDLEVFGRTTTTTE